MNSIATTGIDSVLPYAKVTWAALSAIGFAVNFVTWREAIRDAIYVKRHTTDEAKRIRAWQSVRDEFVTLVVQGAFLWIRVWTLFWPSPDNQWFARNWAVDATLLTAVQMLLAYNCILDLRDRRRTIDVAMR
jgi:hypothetical protein